MEGEEYLQRVCVAEEDDLYTFNAKLTSSYSSSFRRSSPGQV